MWGGGGGEKRMSVYYSGKEKHSCEVLVLPRKMHRKSQTELHIHVQCNTFRVLVEWCE